MKKSSAVLSTAELSMASGGRLSLCRRLGKYLNFHDKAETLRARWGKKYPTRFLMRSSVKQTLPEVEKGENLMLLVFWYFI